MAIRTSPWRDLRVDRPATPARPARKASVGPIGVTLAGIPTRIEARSCCGQLRAHFHLAAARRGGTGRRSRRRRPGRPRRCGRAPGPLVGARMSSRPTARAAGAKLRLGDADPGVGGVARGALAVDIGLGDEAAARPATGARSSSFWASAASARATWMLAASCAASCACTERSTVASTWPGRTQLPASTSTRVTMPPSPAMPTGWSRRAASAPLAVTVRATWLRPGTMTVTVGTWPPRPGRRRRARLPRRRSSSCRRGAAPAARSRPRR